VSSTQGSDDRNIGRVVAGKFQIDSVLGVGNGGMVYQATHLHLRRPVAIKTLRASIAADPTAVARFAREAQLASQLDHPNVVHVFDYGTEPDGLTYIAMELLEGRTLTRAIHDEAPLRAERIVQVLSQVLRGPRRRTGSGSSTAISSPTTSCWSRASATTATPSRR
jgi:serine/threonine-protein kinase